MEVEHQYMSTPTDIMNIKNTNGVNLCGYRPIPSLNKDILWAGYKYIPVNIDIISEKSVLFNEQRIMDTSDYFSNNKFSPENVQKIIMYLYGCDILINIYCFPIFYDMANFFQIDNLKKDLRNNLEMGFINGKYNPNQTIILLHDLYYLNDPYLNEILLSTVAKNFYSLKTSLYYIDIIILADLLSRNDLNIKTEFDLILFLDKFYDINKEKADWIAQLLIPNIRSLTMKGQEVLKSYNISLIRFGSYQKIMNLSENQIEYQTNVDIPRSSVVRQRLLEGNSIDGYEFGRLRGSGVRIHLPDFTAIVYCDKGKIWLSMLNKNIQAEFSDKRPPIGSLINVTKSYLTEKEIHPEYDYVDKVCEIHNYNVIFKTLEF